MSLDMIEPTSTDVADEHIRRIVREEIAAYDRRSAMAMLSGIIDPVGEDDQRIPNVTQARQYHLGQRDLVYVPIHNVTGDGGMPFVTGLPEGSDLVSDIHDSSPSVGSDPSTVARTTACNCGRPGGGTASPVSQTISGRPPG